MEIKKLISNLIQHIRTEDEIVVLFDEKNGTTDVLDYLTSLNEIPNIEVWKSLEFDNDFAKWKNKLNDHCSGDYIVQLDADEMISDYLIQNISLIIEMNPDVDLFYLARINIVEGITQEHLNEWNWSMDEENRINFPDYQSRAFRKGLMWSGNVHERIIGFENYSLFPEDFVYCIQHNKSITRQILQNNFYKSI